MTQNAAPIYLNVELERVPGYNDHMVIGPIRTLKFLSAMPLGGGEGGRVGRTVPRHYDQFGVSKSIYSYD